MEPRGSGAAGRRGSGERRRGDPQRRAVRLSMRRFQVWRLPPFGWRAPTRPACGVPRLVHDAPLGSLASDSREPLPGSEGGRLNPRSGAFFAWPAADAARQVGVVRGAAASRTHCVACGRPALAFGRSRAARQPVPLRPAPLHCAAPRTRPRRMPMGLSAPRTCIPESPFGNDRPRPRRTLGMPRRVTIATPRVRLPCSPPRVRTYASDRVR